MAQKPHAPLFRAPTMNAERVEKLVERIAAGQYAQAELVNLHDNALERGQPTVVEAVVARMRIQFPAAARRKFGAAPKPPKAEKVKAQKAEKLENAANVE
jgi:hypothetical protein